MRISADWVMCATATATTCFIFAVNAPSANTALPKVSNAACRAVGKFAALLGQFVRGGRIHPTGHLSLRSVAATRQLCSPALQPQKDFAQRDGRRVCSSSRAPNTSVTVPCRGPGRAVRPRQWRVASAPVA